jgi:hypothetical protein
VLLRKAKQQKGRHNRNGPYMRLDSAHLCSP